MVPTHTHTGRGGGEEARGKGGETGHAQQLSAVTNDAGVLLASARQEARYVNKRHQGDAKSVTEADEAGGLDRCVDVQGA